MLFGIQYKSIILIHTMYCWLNGFVIQDHIYILKTKFLLFNLVSLFFIHFHNNYIMYFVKSENVRVRVQCNTQLIMKQSVQLAYSLQGNECLSTDAMFTNVYIEGKFLNMESGLYHVEYVPF